MSIKAGTEGGGEFRRRSKAASPGQIQKPIRPVENPFPEKKEFRLGQFRVIEERDDYLICTGYDPNAKNPFAEITPSAFRKIKVAKPPALQRTPWEDSAGVTIGDFEYTFEYSDEEKGVRTARWTDGHGNEQEAEQRIDIPYTLDDEEVQHQIIVAVEIRKSAAVDGMDVEDDDGARLRWMDLNVSGRHWHLISPRDAILDASMSAASNALTGATSTAAHFIVPDPNNPGDLMAGGSFTVVNRSLDAAADSGTYIQVELIGGEWRPVWVDC